MLQQYFYRSTFFMLILVLFVSCSDEWRRKRNSGTWTSADPTSIPYNERMKEYKSGNLVPNSSFEEGTSLSADTSIVQQINKWELKGENVFYIENTSDSVFSPFGKRCVFINKTVANETDSMGEGILSDFIPVLPGNYLFTLSVKAQNIKPQAERLGTKIHDAINIRLLFYDDHRHPVSGAMFYPYYNANLDNEFKGYSFSNFWSIDSLPWSEIHGRTYNYPFSEGDMPDNCKYVRVFIGLKGTGKLWVDNINLHFSRWNFTPRERLHWYKDSVFSKTQSLIPQPVFAVQKENIPLISAGYEKILYPSVVFNTETGFSTRTADYLAHELQSALKPNYPDCNIHTTLAIHPELLAESSIVFYLTDFQHIDTSRFHKIIPGFSSKEQAYVIFDTVITKKRVIILAGKDTEGLFYAATTISKLLDSNTGQLTNALVIDFPAFTGRGFLLSPWTNDSSIEADITNLDYLSYYRFNKAYLPYYQIPNGKQWYKPTEIMLEGTRKIGSWIREQDAMKMGIMINPYNHFEYEMLASDIPDSLKTLWLHNEAGLEMIKNTIRTAFDEGASFIMLMGDDFVPHRESYRKLYDLWADEDIRRHISLQNAQAFVINNLLNWLQSNYGTIRFEFCPPWYLNEFVDKSQGRAEAYFRDLTLLVNEDVVFVWTGNTVRSLQFDHADISRFSALTGHNLMFWDNTMYARSLEGIYGGFPAYYPAKTKFCSLFEPYDVMMPLDFSSVSPHFYANGFPNTELYKIKFATLADFLWNPSAYNPDRSLWKVLMLQFDKETALLLIEFNDIYYRLLEHIIIHERNIRELISSEKLINHGLTKLKSCLANLNSALLKQNPALLQELTTLSLAIEKRAATAIEQDDTDKTTGNDQI